MRLEWTRLPDFLIWPGLVLLGIAVGAYGTMVGVGGGFLLVPVLLLIYPSESPDVITSISLAVVLVNALSGTVAYVRQQRIDFLAGNAFAAATVPGAILGAFATGAFPRRLFDLIFSLALIGLSLLLALRPVPRVASRRGRTGEVTRQITDSQGDTYFYSYNLRLGTGLSIGIGFIAGFLGIGGGVVHVPMMVQVLHFPAHIATATSQYVLTFTSAAATFTHLLGGEYASGLGRIGALAVGVFVGAQGGAWLSMRVRGPMLVRLLSLALGAVGLRLLIGAVLG